jgi:cell division protein FtsL
MLLQPILVKDFLHRVMLLLFLGAGLLVCAQICVYAVNRLYVEKEQKSSLVLNRWCCAT